MPNRQALLYAYLMIAVSAAVLLFSGYLMLQAMTYSQNGNLLQAGIYGVAGAIGIALSVSSITNLRRRMVVLQHVATKVLSQILCAGCGFKVLRTFSTGDYVTKEVGQCQQCKGSMRVDLIYAEDIKPKKN
jgi:hypothetical protein